MFIFFNKWFRSDFEIIKEYDGLRIISKKNRFFTQKKVHGIWTNILCTNDLGWYRAETFNGYDSLKNAEINYNNAQTYRREAVEYYRE